MIIKILDFFREHERILESIVMFMMASGIFLVTLTLFILFLLVLMGKIF